MSRVQLSLDLPIVVSRAAEDFFVSESNRAAVQLIDSWPDWPGGMAILTGPRACGKSHLAAIWRERSDAETLPRDHSAKQILDKNAHLLIEDADQWRQAEDLLHAVNAVREGGKSLLLTGAEPPGNWPVAALADLRSRLIAAPLAEIGDPDEALLAAALAKNFADRQLQPEERVIDYLLPRMPRTFAAARDIADGLDRQSLARGRRITVPLAREILENFT